MTFELDLVKSLREPGDQGIGVKVKRREYVEGTVYSEVDEFEWT